MIEQSRRRGRTRVERVVARVLAMGLAEVPVGSAGADELVRLAGGEASVLRGAILRIEAVSGQDHASWVAARAIDHLAAAITALSTMAAEDPAVTDPPEPVPGSGDDAAPSVA